MKNYIKEIVVETESGLKKGVIKLSIRRPLAEGEWSKSMNKEVCIESFYNDRKEDGISFRVDPFLDLSELDKEQIRKNVKALEESLTAHIKSGYKPTFESLMEDLGFK